MRKEDETGVAIDAGARDCVVVVALMRLPCCDRVVEVGWWRLCCLTNLQRVGDSRVGDEWGPQQPEFAEYQVLARALPYYVQVVILVCFLC